MKSIIILIAAMLAVGSSYATGMETAEERAMREGRNPSDWFVDYDVYVLIIIIVGLICGGFTTYVVDRKGYSPGAWFALGFCFDFTALIAVVGLREKPEEEQRIFRVGQTIIKGKGDRGS